MTRPPAEAAFVAITRSLLSADPHAPTRCAGWTVHELTAHLAAGSAEIADLVEGELAGLPTRATRDFEEREAPYRALSPTRLRRSFFREALRATVAVERLSAAGDGRRVAFTGARLDAPTLILHIESELVLHRWDIAGSDRTGVDALSDPRLASHAATTVAGMRPNVFPARSGDRGTVVLRSPGARDVAVTGGAVTTIEPAPQDLGCPVVSCHPAVRTLLLWGRQPERELPAPQGDRDAVDAVVAMLRPKGSS
ncbi:maleylpyruvate isomerase N-terminal domain-containing protein [Mycobacterium sp. Marseille-P9652]|uniref:maleylpyruvate isomerase N-terminal domain-containing protein n=1 Tax=Mycobacterium sp. Marseille-P9652 TaxID=2654950 RepID=UPI0018D08A37|nr:maleylpyruvate isomerase N-terminal domain-containing protein [Mycobacterium sp. Marseille-P9652]